MADLIRTEYDDCDLSLFNTGTLRSNSVLPKGEVTVRMINDLLPMPDPVILMKVSGEIILSILENAVSAWPALDGRFACFSGLKFRFDPEQPSGSRVHSVNNLDGSCFNLSKEAKYKVAVKHFVAVGKDGYTAFKDPSVEWLIDVNSAISIKDIVLKAFKEFGPDCKLDQKREDIRNLRSALMHANDLERSEAGFVKLRPEIDGRVIQEPKPTPK